MSADNANLSATRNARSKTDLACDVCRRRKSRCDGKRPSCTHCELAGRTCSYRPTPTNFETDASVLTRLGHAENRIGLLEEQLKQFQSNVLQSESAQQPVEVDMNEAKVPHLHTAAGHKILQYWPRLRVKLTIPGIEPFSLLRTVESQELSLQGTVSGRVEDFDYPALVQCIEQLYEKFSELPVTFVHLFKISPNLSRTHILESLLETRRVQDLDLDFNIGDCSIEVLLVSSIASSFSPTEMRTPSSLSALTYFKLALQNFWRLHSEPPQYTVSLMLCFSQIFLYFFARPFHALGILQSAVSVMTQLKQSRIGDELAESQNAGFHILHYLLESDILTELDGLPLAKTTPSLRLPVFSSSTNGFFNSPHSIDSSDVNLTHEYFMSSHLFLRACLNRVLSSLYTASKAYIRPPEAGIFISSVSQELNSWYQSLPLDMQFVRNISSFHLSSHSIKTQMRELSLRYYACHFILNRPVLYFVVYEDMERWATPGSSQQGVDPWVFESCRNCIENAGLIILAQQAHILSPDPDPCHSWCELQLLVGSYAVLLQVQTVPAFAPVFGDLREIDRLLDAAEMVFSRVPFDSVGVERTLEVLRNIRQNFSVGTPL